MSSITTTYSTDTNSIAVASPDYEFTMYVYLSGGFYDLVFIRNVDYFKMKSDDEYMVKSYLDVQMDGGLTLQNLHATFEKYAPIYNEHINKRYAETHAA